MKNGTDTVLMGMCDVRTIHETYTYILASYEFIANAVLFTSIIRTICEAVARASYNFPMAADPSILASGCGRFQFVGRLHRRQLPDGRKADHHRYTRLIMPNDT